MSEDEIDTLFSIIRDYIVYHGYEVPTETERSKEEIAWHKRHSEYVQKDILNKIIKGREK